MSAPGKFAFFSSVGLEESFFCNFSVGMGSGGGGGSRKEAFV